MEKIATKMEFVGHFINITINDKPSDDWQLAAPQFAGDPDVIPLYRRAQVGAAPVAPVVQYIEPWMHRVEGGGYNDSRELTDHERAMEAEINELRSFVESLLQPMDEAAFKAWAVENGFEKYHDSMFAAWEESHKRALAQFVSRLPVQPINMAQTGVGPEAVSYTRGWNECLTEMLTSYKPQT